MVNTFPGGVGVSGLRVYDWPTADGLCGGSPHVHLTCAEAYVVVGGAGRVQTLNHQGFTETPLTSGTVVWFTPGTIHRAVNDGDLRIVVVMQNSGLPEAGDAVFTFPPGVLADPSAYGRAAALADGAHVHATNEEAARRRRDLAIEGFLDLRRRFESGDTAALDDFYAAAVQLKSDRFEEWESRWRAGALASAERTGDHLTALRKGDLTHLREAELHHQEAPATDDRRLGMCGRLDVYDLT